MKKKMKWLPQLIQLTQWKKVAHKTIFVFQQIQALLSTIRTRHPPFLRAGDRTALSFLVYLILPWTNQRCKQLKHLLALKWTLLILSGFNYNGFIEGSGSITSVIHLDIGWIGINYWILCNFKNVSFRFEYRNTRSKFTGQLDSWTHFDVSNLWAIFLCFFWGAGGRGLPQKRIKVNELLMCFQIFSRTWVDLTSVLKSISKIALI